MWHPASGGTTWRCCRIGEVLERLLIAAALGSLIGFERERLLWAAGIRTHMLVCVGSVPVHDRLGLWLQCQHVVGTCRARSVTRGTHRWYRVSDFSAQGAILARGEVVKGLTTAASIWTVAAIGLRGGRRSLFRRRRLDGGHRSRFSLA